jgi:predicted glutamine amidotransferase
MCRLLYIKSKNPISIPQQLHTFATIAQQSKEYQGHGWGLAYLQDDEWNYYHNISPIWEDNLHQFGETVLMLAHARSAYQDRGIAVENNMPFYDQQYVYIFNGELHGVRIKTEGRIGAEKIFNFIRQLNRGNMAEAIIKAQTIIENRSSYIRAMNFIIADKEHVYVASRFNEDEDYFTMYYKQTASSLIICSEKYPGEKKWTAIKNNSVRVFQ